MIGDRLAGTSTDLYAGSRGDDLLADLPDDTAIAFAAGLSDDWVSAFVTQVRTQYSFGDITEKKILTSLKKATGLDLPTDLEGVEGVSLVLGSGFSPEALFDQTEDASVAVRISGDHGKTDAALEKIRKRIGAKASAQLISRRLGDDVVIGTNAAYLDQLAKGGDLTGSDRFGDVVPDAENATTAYFLNFGAGDWLVKSAETDGERKNLAPLGTAGLTVAKNGDQQKMLFRLTFD